MFSVRIATFRERAPAACLSYASQHLPGSVPRRSASAALELAHKYNNGNHCECEPPNHPEAIHETQEEALPEQLLIDDAE